jgi:hypothetical protein
MCFYHVRSLFLLLGLTHEVTQTLDARFGVGHPIAKPTFQTKIPHNLFANLGEHTSKRS